MQQLKIMKLAEKLITEGRKIDKTEKKTDIGNGQGSELEIRQN